LLLGEPPFNEKKGKMAQKNVSMRGRVKKLQADNNQLAAYCFALLGSLKHVHVLAEYGLSGVGLCTRHREVLKEIIELAKPALEQHDEARKQDEDLDNDSSGESSVCQEEAETPS